VPIPKNDAGEQLRLSVREYEVFLADSDVADDTIVRVTDIPQTPNPADIIASSRVKYRLAYADHLPLEDARRPGTITSRP
jgi:hypothetical protein